MRSLMASISIAAVAAMGLGFSASTASAKNFCYNFDGFDDILDVQAAKKKNGHRLVYGTWTSPSYTVVIAGAMEVDAQSGETRIGVTGTTNSTDFNNNLICGIDGIPGGPWKINCTGGPSASVQFFGDTLAEIPCGGAPGKSRGPVLGE